LPGGMTCLNLRHAPAHSLLISKCYFPHLTAQPKPAEVPSHRQEPLNSLLHNLHMVGIQNLPAERMK
jgi:hypothetical protein